MTLQLWWAEQKSHLQSAIRSLEVEDLIDQLLLTMSPGKEPKGRDCSPSLTHGSCHWGYFLLDCPWTTPPLSLTRTHSSIQWDPIRPFHMVAPHAMEALPRPIHNQTNCHVKSNNGQDPKSNIFSCKRKKGVGGKKKEKKKSTTANLTKLASNKCLSVRLGASGALGDQINSEEPFLTHTIWSKLEHMYNS